MRYYKAYRDMDKVNRFFELKELWKQAAEPERPAIDREITQLLDGMTEEETDRLALAVEDDFGAIHREADAILEQLSLRERLAPVLPYLSVSRIARDYFGKSASWFYQRLNGNQIRGKVCRFTEGEMRTLDMALKDISRRMASLNVL